MKTKTELFIFAGTIVILALLRLPMESSDVFILPFLVLVLIRLWYLIQKGELLVQKEVFNFKNAKKAGLLYFFLTVIVILALWFFRNKISLPIWLSDNDWVWFISFHVLFQEIIFRTYLINRLKVVFSSPLAISLLSGAIFGGMHFILPNAVLIATFTFFMGTLWSYLYYKYPNLIYVWLSHLAINLSINFFYL
ncbi:MAG: CPBP family intramembrane metalloprotease [bacterium]|nr:CPBP family intramembrane metalloprotease [bacterium]